MLTAVFAFLTMILTTYLAPTNLLWALVTAQSFIIAVLSFLWFTSSEILPTLNQYLLVDEISSPLLILTFWLTPLTLLASQSKISKEPASRQRSYIFSILFLQITTALAFLANNLMLFFIFFESTMIPTLIVITRWGTQKERIMAGIYMLFYTLAGSLLLLTAILYFHESFGSLTISMLKKIQEEQMINFSSTIWWLACLVAFLVKMPLYGLHLWLPKAHVEAPIAGSMILAGTLLKLGGYGLLRMSTLINESMYALATPLIIFSMCGVVASALLCSRQTDLKSLIAFSSVSHMGLVVAASMIKSPWSVSGAMILMISHGLISSALFCLANTAYERTSTRTMVVLQGSQVMLPLAAAWWLLSVMLNMALPPSTNFMGELLILQSIFKWAPYSIILAGLGIIFTTSYSLYLFWSSQREHLPTHLKSMPPTVTREHILLALHILPIIFLIIKPELIF
uniref:NADH-ubiquinone oxidoreductase chain 4 n=1 Tax=Platyplectrum melanopyga TaxID=3345241 RepID=K9JYW0_PLAME|nr:NADH dehydrogenase subunit 4 [Lechriodus melanopyga]AEC33158.1 NADH dehydrogenase subunit 4 [Lechriodus melanopyga]